MIIEILIRNKCRNEEARAGFGVTWVASGCAPGLGGGCCQRGGTESRAHQGQPIPGVTSWDNPRAVPTTINSLLALPTPSQPCSLSWRCLLCCGFLSAGTNHHWGFILPQTRATNVPHQSQTWLTKPQASTALPAYIQCLFLHEKHFFPKLFKCQK